MLFWPVRVETHGAYLFFRERKFTSHVMMHLICDWKKHPTQLASNLFPGVTLKALTRSTSRAECTLLMRIMFDRQEEPNLCSGEQNSACIQMRRVPAEMDLGQTPRQDWPFAVLHSGASSVYIGTVWTRCEETFSISSPFGSTNWYG